MLRRLTIIVIFLALLTLYLPSASVRGFAYPTQPSGLPSAIVVTVIDGDTADVVLNGRTERLRMIGIDTPETRDPRTPVQCFGHEASTRANELLAGQTVHLEADASQDTRDRYGRLLVYLWVGGRLFNVDMIAEGYAHEYTFEAAYKYQTLFKEAEQEANVSNRGFWSPSTCNGDTSQPAAVAGSAVYLPLVQKAVPMVAPTVEPTATTAPTATEEPSSVLPTPTRTTGPNCHPSYPTVCIPPPPPDLDCGDIPHRRFPVRPPDPHRLDGDSDGIGCES